MNLDAILRRDGISGLGIDTEGIQGSESIARRIRSGWRKKGAKENREGV